MREKSAGKTAIASPPKYMVSAPLRLMTLRGHLDEYSALGWELVQVLPYYEDPQQLQYVVVWKKSGK